MSYIRETYLHDTSMWTVKKANGDTEPFDGDKAKEAIKSAILDIPLYNYGAMPNVDQPERLATIITVQLCNDINRLIKNDVIEDYTLSTNLIRYLCERQIAVTCFDAAKAYILKGKYHIENAHDQEIINKLNMTHPGITLTLL